jgi:hypothetical protein
VQVVRVNLAAVGIDVRIRKLHDLDAAIAAGAKSDLLDIRTELPYPDSASFLARMFDDIPSGWIPAGVRAQVERVAGSSGDGRQAQAASLCGRRPFAPLRAAHARSMVGRNDQQRRTPSRRPRDSLLRRRRDEA